MDSIGTCAAVARQTPPDPRFRPTMSPEVERTPEHVPEVVPQRQLTPLFKIVQV